MLPLYNLPAGRWMDRFLLLQTQLLCDVREPRCNAEKAMVFAPYILRKVWDKHLFGEQKILI